MFNPREALGFLTWKVQRLFVNDLTSRFSEANIGVTVEQWRALLPVYKSDGITQGRLCEVLSQEKTGVSRLVAALEKRELIRRKSGEKDRRVKSLFITDAGRQLVEDSLDLVMATREWISSSVAPEDMATCNRVLWQIIEANDDTFHCCPKPE